MGNFVVGKGMQQELLEVLRHARLAFEDRGDSGACAGAELHVQATRAFPDGVPIDAKYLWRELVVMLYGPVLGQLAHLQACASDHYSSRAISEVIDQIRGLPDLMGRHDVPWEMERQLQIPVNVEDKRARPDRSVSPILGGLKWVRLEGDGPYRHKPKTPMPGGEE